MGEQGPYQPITRVYAFPKGTFEGCSEMQRKFDEESAEAFRLARDLSPRRTVYNFFRGLIGFQAHYESRKMKKTLERKLRPIRFNA